MSAFAREPRRKAAELIMVLDEQHPMSGLREHIGTREAAQAASDHDDIILVGDTFEPVVSHEKGTKVNASLATGQCGLWTDGAGPSTKLWTAAPRPHLCSHAETPAHDSREKCRRRAA